MSIARFAPLLAAAAALSLNACAKVEEADPNLNMDAGVDITMPNDAMTAPAAPTAVTVGGAEMLATRNIVENASNSADHTTMVSAVKAAGLVETLSGAGPFTVFAPTNAAFAKLPAGTVDGLLKPEAKADLTKALTYHVVAGRMTAADLASAIKAGGGKAALTTVQGGKLTATEAGGMISLTDAKGGTSTVTQADVPQSNGVIHVVDTVLMP